MQVMEGPVSSSSSTPPKMLVPMTTSHDMVRCLAATSPVVVFASGGCCMCYVVKQLLLGLGVAPIVINLDDPKAFGIVNDKEEINMVLHDLSGSIQQPLPAVFVGGKYLGGIEIVMACHINGTLVPLLKDAGALWL